MSKKTKCAHESCKCVVEDHEEFCSEYCLEAREVTELGCGCEHPPCIDQL